MLPPAQAHGVPLEPAAPPEPSEPTTPSLIEAIAEAITSAVQIVPRHPHNPLSQPRFYQIASTLQTLAIQDRLTLGLGP
jgi:hypothetical protein